MDTRAAKESAAMDTRNVDDLSPKSKGRGNKKSGGEKQNWGGEIPQAIDRARNAAIEAAVQFQLDQIKTYPGRGPGVISRAGRELLRLRKGFGLGPALTIRYFEELERLPDFPDKREFEEDWTNVEMDFVDHFTRINQQNDDVEAITALWDTDPEAAIEYQLAKLEAFPVHLTVLYVTDTLTANVYRLGLDADAIKARFVAACEDVRGQIMANEDPVIRYPTIILDGKEIEDHTQEAIVQPPQELNFSAMWDEKMQDLEECGLPPANDNPKPESKEGILRAVIERLAALDAVQVKVCAEEEAKALTKRFKTKFTAHWLTLEVNRERKAKRSPPPPIDDNPPDEESKVYRVVNKINSDHAFIKSRGGKACVLHEGFDEAGEPNEYYYGINDFYNIMANQGVANVGGDEEPKWVPKSKVWMQDPLRRQYQSVVFDPRTTNRDVRGHYNLWRGFGVEPVKGSWDLMREHIRAILAAGDKDADAYIYNWLAWGVQNPEMQAEAALVAQGPRGTGKGVVYRTYTSLFGRRHGLHISSSALLTGRFSAHLEKCAQLFADEAFHAGDKHAESQLKRIITEPTLIIEGKGKDAFQAPNRLKILMASNDDWVAPVGPRERRFAIFKVCEDKIGDKPYFTKLYNEIKAGGMSAMLYDLLHADIEGFHPRWSIPQNEALRDQARHSLTPEMKWLFSLLQEGALPYSTNEEPEQGSFVNLIDDARKAIDRKKPLQNAELAELLTDWDVQPKHTNMGNFWIFPPLKEMRERFNRDYGKQKWNLSEGWLQRPSDEKPVKKGWKGRNLREV